MKSTLLTIALNILATVALIIGVQGSADAAPPGSCDPWPECKDGGGSDYTVAFSETCKNLKQWTVTGNWTTSRGECLAKNNNTEHTMTTATDLDLLGAFEAQLNYKFRINNADSLRISASADGGSNFVDVKEYVGTESGTISLNLADYVDLTDKIRLRASCLVSAGDAICGWDNIKIETVTSPPGELVVTINTPQARTYGVMVLPLTYEVELSHRGTVEYYIGSDGPLGMTPDEGGTVHTDLGESLSTGIYSFQAIATDDFDNTGTQTVEFTVDNQAPTIEFVFPTPPTGSSQTSSVIPVKLATNSGLDHYSFVVHYTDFDSVMDFDSDLFLWLSMEEVEGDYVIDASSYHNDGLVEGDAFLNPNGKFGSAFEFDGINHGGDIPTDRIVIPGFQDQYPIFDTSFTVMAWAKPDINEKMVIVGTKSITNLPGWHLRTSGGSHRLRMGVNTGYTSETAASAETSDPMEPGVWVHVVGIYDSTVPAIHLYLDGAWVDTKTDSDGVVSTGYGNDLELAIAVPEDPQKAWDGLVDEVLIFNRVLDAVEIKALYDSTANQFHKNYLGLDSGVHEFIGYSINAAGNKNQTEVRSVTIE